MILIGKIIDLTGQKFGRWTVKDYAYTKNRKAYWYCDCSCGTKNVAVSVVSLRFGSSKSCGCVQKEIISQYGKASKKYNIYDLTNDKYGIGYTSNTNEPFYFDLEDYNLIKAYTWFKDCYGYICTEYQGERFKIHRLIILKENKNDLSIKIDHINGKESRNDNRKSNLRKVSSQENNRNKTYTSDSTSGFIGVSFRKNRNKWRAYITVDGKQINLGVFKCFTDAVKTRIEAEIKYFGEFAYNAHLKILEYINNGGTLTPYDRKQIENIMNN